MKNAVLVNIDECVIKLGHRDVSIFNLYPSAIHFLFKLQQSLGFELVFIKSDHALAEKLTLSLLSNEQIRFGQLSDIPSAKIYVIGSSLKSETYAAELGATYIDFGSHQSNWEQVFQYFVSQSRIITHIRNTKETRIAIQVNLDGQGIANINTGLHFFDHMLDQIARHSGIDLSIEAKGDLHIDEHHTVEDTAITLGEAMLIALGNKKGIERYGYCLPMDESLAQVAIDFGGRSYLVWDAVFNREKVGDVPTELFSHFFKSFSDAAKCNLNIKVEGANEHHKIEAIFKAFAKAIKMAVARNLDNQQLPSTKGVL